MIQNKSIKSGNLSINKIKLYNEPRKKVVSQYDIPVGEPEMSEFESGYLCGVLKERQPQKIVEVGIAGGATTAIILECMEELKIKYKVFSIDYAKNFYKDHTKQSGYLAEQIINDKHLEDKHKFLLGDIAYNFIDNIGGEIDCLILDTVHLLPGEVLDVITLIPFMKKGGIVIMHDIAWNLYSDVKYGYATGSVMASVVGKKYINYDFTRKGLYPNIGAFEVCEDTIENIGNLFLQLLVTWRYIPDEKQLSAYRKAIGELYTDTEMELFDRAIELNKRTVGLKTRIREAIKMAFRGYTVS